MGRTRRNCRILTDRLGLDYSREKNGGRTWARTKDPLIKSQLLYQLSYASIPGRF